MAYIDKVTVGSTDYDIQDTKAQGDITDLKSAIQQMKVIYPVKATSWSNGYIVRTNGTVGSSQNYVTSNFIVSNGKEHTVSVPSPRQIAVAEYSASGDFVSLLVAYEVGTFSFTVSEGNKYRICFGLTNMPTSPSDVDTLLTYTETAFTDESMTQSGKSADAYETGKIRDKVDKLAELVPYPFTLIWTAGKYILSNSGITGNASSMACTEEYYAVSEGQKLAINLYANGTNECAVAFYNESKVYDATKYVTSDGEKIITVPFDGFARFSTKVAQVSTEDAYVKNYVDDEDASMAFGNKKYYIRNASENVADTATLGYTARFPKVDFQHNGAVTPASRFLAIGFDDFRASDFGMIMPLFEKYGASATFNRFISDNETPSELQKNRMNCTLFGAHEPGDHTILHYACPYEDALFNGQNPGSLDGSQTPYPTNEQMRGTEGATYNAFHCAVTSNASAIGVNGLDATIANTAWKDLTDAQCQTIRETFSALKNPVLAPLLDEMSNYYLGTSGRSDGSWDSSTGKYTGGIFTGCATSANHEIWERILTIVQMYYKEKFGMSWDMQCWSWPGEHYWGRGFSSDGHNKYYKSDMTLLFNMNARFTSSLYVDELGNAKVRSFTDVLREFGYKYTHDYIYPGRMDYQAVPAMRRQFFLNEHLSKQDGVLYPTDRTVTYSAVNTSYPATFFTAGKTKAAQMYDGGGVFYNFIEALRHDTAHGLVHGEVIDSTDSYSMRVFFEEALRFCKAVGIHVVTKAEAFDACFNNPVESGNLIYNPQFRNTVAEYFTDATNVPTNPDGYSGTCSVSNSSGENILSTSGDVTYIHYGIPLGKIKYLADVKGTGSITVSLIKCSTNENLSDTTSLATKSVDSSGAFAEQEIDMLIPDNPVTTWSQRLEGRNDKIMGIKIVYSSGLQIKNIRLIKQ